MKKILLGVITAAMLFAFVPTSISATAEPIPIAMDSTRMEESEAVKALTLRLEEIKAIDKSTLTRTEKKELRKEVRAIKHQVKKLSGGVYISATTLIVLLILIIILA